MPVGRLGPMCSIDRCHRPLFKDELCARHWYASQSVGRRTTPAPSVTRFEALKLRGLVHDFDTAEFATELDTYRAEWEGEDK